MTLSRRTIGLIAVLSGLLLSSAAFAQTTGGLGGTVTDRKGAPLPGVLVSVSGPALQGDRSVQSDELGRYRVPLLPPGLYKAEFKIDGFAPASKGNISVPLGKEITLNVQMREDIKEEVTVETDATQTEFKSTDLGRNLDTRQIETLPTTRGYTGLVQVVPGVSTDANPENKGSDNQTITVYGSSGAENSFSIDGVNTTGVEYGFRGKNLNYEFIDAVEVKTGGYEAEFGRSTGGIINVITKSGGNEFKGDAFTYYDNDSLQRDPKAIVNTGGQVVGFTKKDYGVDFGGFIVKDKLWYFGAYDRVDNTDNNELPSGPDAGKIVDKDTTRDTAAAKLTWKINGNQSLIGTFFQDPEDQVGAISDGNHSLNGDPSTYIGKQKYGGRDYGLRYEAIYNKNFIFTAQVARHQEENSVGPGTAAGNAIQYRDTTNDFFQSGGFGLIQEKQFKRDFFGSSLAWYGGNHEVKVGVEYEKEQADVVKRMSGGQQVDVYPPISSLSPNGIPPAVFVHRYWTTPDATIDNAPVSQLNAHPEHKNLTVYAQDRWSVAPNFSISYGLRWDQQEIIDASGVTQIKLSDDYAPRLGFVWDPTEDQKTRVFGSMGRYYEQIPMDLVIRSFSYERQPRIVNFDPTSVVPDPDAEAAVEISSAILGGFTEPSDPNIKGQYISEYILGFERQVMPNYTLGVKLIHRSYDRVIEDFLCKDDGTYCIGNPGHGIMERVFTLDYSRTFPAPEPKRVYRGVQVDLTKRFSDNWQGIASYIWSKLDGNYDGEYAPFTNVGADPNISAAYDYYDFFTDGVNLNRITNNGPLANDRRHQFKVSGTWYSPIRLEVGLSAFYRTGTPLTRYGYSDAYGRWEFFLDQRGSAGRNPSTYDLDLHLGYPLQTGKLTWNFLLDFFNLLNRQRPALLDQRWGFAEADNASNTPVNPGYGKPVIRTAPASVRLGFRLSW